jgi:predicted ArsR family transcriptional regulator
MAKDKEWSRSLNPTLWRTCRTLANRTRLRLLRHLLLNPGLAVTEIAAELELSPAVASKYLRELNARGLLLATRRALKVFYRVSANQAVPQAVVLIKALSGVLKNDKAPIDLIYRKVTAFTHPRRVAIVACLRRGPVRLVALRRQLGISNSALQRHLHKLAARGFLQTNQPPGVYAVIKSGAALETALLRLTSIQ